MSHRYSIALPLVSPLRQCGEPLGLGFSLGKVKMPAVPSQDVAAAASFYVWTISSSFGTSEASLLLRRDMCI